jgi:hypothetical protein
MKIARSNRTRGRIVRVAGATVFACLAVGGIAVGVGSAESVRGVTALPQTTPKPTPDNPGPPNAEAAAMARGTPGPLPVRPLFRTATAAEVLAGIKTDSFYQRVMAQSGQPGTPLTDARVAGGTLGTPLFVRALLPGTLNYWLIPVLHEGQAVAAFSVGIDQAGRGAVAGFRGWAYDTMPAVPESVARLLGAAPGLTTVTAELVWSQVPGRPSDMLNPFWRIVRSDGTRVYVFSDRAVLPPAEVEP